jgi:spermidine synthase
MYAPRSLPRQRLSSLLALFGDPDADAMPVSWAATSEATAMAAYWQARRRYLELGMTVRLDGHAQQALEQLEAPLESLLELSPRFTPAADALDSLRSALPSTSDSNPAR